MAGTVLILVRHGATYANVCRPYLLQGLRPDSELIREGEKQARSAAHALRTYPLARVYASPLKRAWKTAELIAEPHALAVETEEGVIEADIGRWSGLSWPEIERRWPDDYRAFHDDPERFGYPDGETLGQVRSRALAAIGRLSERHPGETILVVSHGVVNRVLLAHWTGMPLRRARTIPQDNGALNLVQLNGDSARVVTLNSVPAEGLTASQRFAG
jgi:broad specificity phosphatase PhoE